MGTTGYKISGIQWVRQRLMYEPRFQMLGPLVNEFLIDAFSCIKDERHAFHANNYDMYRAFLHHTSAQARIPRRRRDSARPVQRIVVLSSFGGGFTDQAKKLTEAMAILRRFGRKASYFITMTCKKVRLCFAFDVRCTYFVATFTVLHRPYAVFLYCCPYHST